MLDRSRLAELRHEVGEDDLAEVVALFCEEVHETLERLLASPKLLTSDDLHFLKGSALNIGLSDFGSLCQSAERTLRERPGADPGLAEIARVFGESHRALVASLENRFDPGTV